MKLFKQYLKESLVVENTELADLRKHLHDQQMKYAAAQKRKDKRAMDFWNNAIKNTEEEIKYYENENFSSTVNDDDDANDPIKRINGLVNIKHKEKIQNAIKNMLKDFKNEDASLDDLKIYLKNLLGIKKTDNDWITRANGIVDIDSKNEFIANSKMIYNEMINDEAFNKNEVNSYFIDLINKI